MSYLLLGRTPGHSLLTGDPVIPREAVIDVETALSLVGEAEKRAEAIGLAAHRARDAALEAGRREGYRAGRAEAEREGAETLARLEIAARNARRTMRGETVRLALEVVHRIAGRLGEDAMVKALAEEAVRELVPDRPVVVRVHPDRVEAVRHRLTPHGERVAVEADAGLRPAGCVLVSDIGRVDAGLDTQLAAIERALAGEVDD